MKTIIDNCVYQSEEQFLSNDECQELKEFILKIRGKNKNKRITKICINKDMIEKWSKKIMSLPFPDWTDKKGRIWTPTDISPVFHCCHYYQGIGCNKHLDERYIVENDELKMVLRENPADMDIFSSSKSTDDSAMGDRLFRGKLVMDMDQFQILEQFKFLIYLDDLNESATRIYSTQDGYSARDCKDYIRIIPKKGHFVIFSLDMWHDGEIVKDTEKSIIGFRIRYSHIP